MALDTVRTKINNDLFYSTYRTNCFHITRLQQILDHTFFTQYANIVRAVASNVRSSLLDLLFAQILIFLTAVRPSNDTKIPHDILNEPDWT